MTKKGYSLIELIIVIVILSIAIPMLVYMLGNLAAQSIASEKRTTATFLCQEKIEEIIADRWNPNIGFDNIPVGSFSESIPGFPDFSRSVSIVYVTKSGSSFVDSASPPYYKRARVWVSHSEIGEVRLETIIGIR